MRFGCSRNRRGSVEVGVAVVAVLVLLFTAGELALYDQCSVCALVDYGLGCDTDEWLNPLTGECAQHGTFGTAGATP
jgi:hypothetical protein